MVEIEEVKEGNIYIVVKSSWIQNQIAVIVSRVHPEDDLWSNSWNIALLDDVLHRNGEDAYPDKNIPTVCGVYYWARNTEMKKIKIKKR